MGCWVYSKSHRRGNGIYSFFACDTTKGAGLGNSARVTCDFDKKVHFEECQQVPTGSGSSTSQPMTVHVVDQSGDAYHPLPRQVLN